MVKLLFCISFDREYVVTPIVRKYAVELSLLYKWMVDILNLGPYDSVYFSHFWNTTDATIPNHS
jgi:hypothetical protein